MYFIALLLQTIIDKGLEKSPNGNFREWDDIYKSKINADMIVQGSSRAWVQFSPKILDSAFNCNSYNLGIDGYGFQMQYYRFLIYLKHNKKPKYIIQNVDHFLLNLRPDLFEYEQFLPYLDDKNIRIAVTPYNGLNWKDFYIPLFKYHSNYEIAFEGLSNYFHATLPNNGKYKGFLARNWFWDDSFMKFKKSNPQGYRIKIDSNTNILFGKYLDYCKMNHINVIFIYTPEYIEAQKLLLNRDSITRLINNYAVAYNIPFINYSNDELCSDTSCFYNSQHLNKKGVFYFNQKLSKDLKQYIQF